MSQELQPVQKFATEVMKIWSEKAQIKKLFAPDLTDQEFDFFCGLGMTMKANPFKREIWAVKYDKSKPASIFVGRDFLRKVAQEQSDYNGHTAQAVYSDDDFIFDTEQGVPHHTFDVTKPRGDIVGAYGIAYRKGVDRAFFVYIPFAEANKNQSTWKSQPCTMVEKVAEARVLRMAWQGLFSGTYAEDESPIIEADHKPRIDYKQKTADLKNGKSNEDDRATDDDRKKLAEKGTKAIGSLANFNRWLSAESDGRCISVDSVQTKDDCRKFWKLLDQFLTDLQPENKELKYE